MSLLKTLTKVHGMSDTVWQRHANPASGLSRIAILPLLALAIWSRGWIGGWCLLPIAGLIFFTWINPRLFPPPGNTSHWMSRAVMGERVWLNAAEIPVPAHHLAWARGLSALSALGLPPLAWGLYAYEAYPVLLGLALVITGKLWFLDRMAWLYADMKDTPPYNSWAR